MVESRRFYRFLEVIPGTLVWTTFIGAFILSFIKPLWVIGFIVILSTLWFFRVVYFVFYLCVSFQLYRKAQATNWGDILECHPNWKTLIHAVVLPTSTEPLEIIVQTLESLIHSDYPTKRILVVLSGEERSGKQFTIISEIIRKKYQSTFFDLITTTHPDDLPGEMKAKGANAHWAGERLKKYCDTHQIAYEKVIVSYFDCDTCVAPNYFTILTGTFLEHPARFRTAFQPIAVFNNNIWHSPVMTRVSAFSTTFWLMTELARPDRLYTFSSHAMSLVPLVDVDFWQRDVVSDDSRIFLQCFFRYHGDFSVTPLYALVSMNTAMSNTWWKSMKNLYKQQRRWAYGVEHFPYLVTHLLNDPTIGWATRRKFIWNLMEGFYTWATTPILLFVFVRLPLWILDWNNAPASLFAYNTPIAIHWLMILCSVGIMASAVVMHWLLPKRPRTVGVINSLSMLLQWLLLPINLIVFGSIPATEAQTRLMFGYYLGFHVSDKVQPTV